MDRMATMAASRLGRCGIWRNVTARPLSVPRQTSFRPFRQQRFASYQNFPGRGTQQQYSRFRTINRAHYIWTNYRRAVITVSAGSGAVYVYNLEPVPITGRRRFNIVSPETEKSIMEGGYPQMLAELRGQILPAEHPYTRMVANVVERLLPSVKGLAGNDWKVHVVDDPKQKNAFVMPGGKVFVFTGLLPICQDEEGLATVIGHEIAHNVAHHAAERLSHSVFLLPFVIVASMLFDVSGSVVHFFTDLIFSLPNSRTHEAEADHIGLLMMAESCYNPEAAIPFWERMKKAQQGAPPEFLSTHPSDYNRIRAITGWLDEAKEKYNQSECGITSGYSRKFSEAFGKRGALGRKQPVIYKPPPPPQDDDDFF
jgi:metalloendopeptidase OMA1, mitochondrial